MSRDSARPPGIYGFTGNYRFLSNFFLEPDNTCVEEAYQAAKCADFTQRAGFEGIGPHRAKARGQRVKLREDWEQVRDEIMLFHVTKKFKDHPKLAKALAMTEPLYLEETNDWHDIYWGVCNGYCPKSPEKAHPRQGLNVLGQILMQIREEL